ncbi:protein kinase domain-containing protein [Ditylenchus destructor]|uniref:non-specific serine/threonine protein kinase n=1 Tax=Ditylenchus destructor TaxID=166010 RepID=A0AAD4MI92_9BILA|nr:protein kinase domain-containing protein [Ditylenchus destructor]
MRAPILFVFLILTFVFVPWIESPAPSKTNAKNPFIAKPGSYKSLLTLERLFEQIDFTEQVLRFYVAELIVAVEHAHLVSGMTFSSYTLDPDSIYLANDGSIKIRHGSEQNDTTPEKFSADWMSFTKFQKVFKEQTLSPQGAEFFEMIESYDSSKFASEKDGIAKIKDHKWFKNSPAIDWRNIKFDTKVAKPFLYQDNGDECYYVLDATNNFTMYAEPQFRFDHMSDIKWDLLSISKRLDSPEIKVEYLKTIKENADTNSYEKILEQVSKYWRNLSLRISLTDAALEEIHQLSRKSVRAHLSPETRKFKKCLILRFNSDKEIFEELKQRNWGVTEKQLKSARAEFQKGLQEALKIETNLVEIYDTNGEDICKSGRVTRKTDKKMFAVKCMKEIGKNVDSEMRLSREMKSSYFASHEGLFKLKPDVYVLVTELITGGTIENLMKTTELSEIHVRFFAFQLVLALDYLHMLVGMSLNGLSLKRIVFGDGGTIKITELGSTARSEQAMDKFDADWKSLVAVILSMFKIQGNNPQLLEGRKDISKKGKAFISKLLNSNNGGKGHELCNHEWFFRPEKDDLPKLFVNLVEYNDGVSTPFLPAADLGFVDVSFNEIVFRKGENPTVSNAVVQLQNQLKQSTATRKQMVTSLAQDKNAKNCAALKPQLTSFIESQVKILDNIQKIEENNSKENKFDANLSAIKARFESEISKVNRLLELTTAVIHIEGNLAEKKFFKEQNAEFASIYNEKSEPSREDINKYYELKEELGKGSFGVVNLAVETSGAHRTFAIKKLKFSWRGSGEGEKEVKLLRAMDNKYLAPNNNEVRMVMDLVSGGQINYLASSIALPELARRYYVAQFLKAFEYMHVVARVQHDDAYSTRNVLVTENGTLKLIDYGMAKLRNSDNFEDYKDDWNRIYDYYHPTLDVSDAARSFFSLVAETPERRSIYGTTPFVQQVGMKSVTVFAKFLQNHEWFKMDPPINWDDIRYSPEVEAPYLPKKDADGDRFYYDVLNKEKHYCFITGETIAKDDIAPVNEYATSRQEVYKLRKAIRSKFNSKGVTLSELQKSKTEIQQAMNKFESAYTKIKALEYTYVKIATKQTLIVKEEQKEFLEQLDMEMSKAGKQRSQSGTGRGSKL